MTPLEVKAAIVRLLDCEQYSPGQAFDALLELRRNKIHPGDVAVALAEKTTTNSVTIATSTDPLTDESPMPWGKYRGKRLIDVPVDYWRWLIAQPQPIHDQRLVTWLTFKGYKKPQTPIDDNDNVPF
jgi:hypothetical protein